MSKSRKPTHPGEVLREDVLKPLGLTITDAAQYPGVTRKTLSTLLNCKSGLSPEMAIHISKATKTSPESWLFMQAKRDLWLASQKPSDVKVFKELISV